MALVQLFYGQEEKIPAAINEGALYFTTDTKAIVFDAPGGQRIKVVGNAQGGDSLINSIKAGENELPIQDGVVTIPVATNNLVGLVKGSTAENSIEINSKGELFVYNVNINKITQTPNEEIILNCGDSNIKTQEGE